MLQNVEASELTEKELLVEIRGNFCSFCQKGLCLNIKKGRNQIAEVCWNCAKFYETQFHQNKKYIWSFGAQKLLSDCKEDFKRRALVYRHVLLKAQ